MIRELFNKVRCRLLGCKKRTVRSGVWSYVVCDRCDYVGPSFFSPRLRKGRGSANV